MLKQPIETSSLEEQRAAFNLAAFLRSPTGDYQKNLGSPEVDLSNPYLINWLNTAKSYRENPSAFAPTGILAYDSLGEAGRDLKNAVREKRNVGELNFRNVASTIVETPRRTIRQTSFKIKDLKARDIVYALSVGSAVLAVSHLGAVLLDHIAHPHPSLAAGPDLIPNSVFTVCPDGPPVCDFSDVQPAIDAAVAGDTVKVAEGTYNQLHQTSCSDPLNNINQVVCIDGKDINLTGGYDNSFTEPPDAKTHPTILDAQKLGRVMMIRGSSPEVEGFTITGGNLWNANGAGIWSLDSSPTLRNLRITDNQVANIGRGGGIAVQGYKYGTTASFERLIIEGNRAQLGGGVDIYQNSGIWRVIVVAGNEDVEEGAGIRIVQSTPSIYHATIVGNNGLEGSGLHIGHDVNFPPIKNIILANNKVGVVEKTFFTPEITNVLLWNNQQDGSGAITWLNRYSGDPAFASSYHIGPTSAARFKGQLIGNITHDIDGDRFRNPPALGADELRCIDSDSDNQVTAADLQAMASHWREETRIFDLDGDGRVTVIDLTEEASYFGESCW